MNEQEKHLRLTLANMLMKGDSLAACLGGMIEVTRLCGHPDEREIATAIDGFIRKLLQDEIDLHHTRCEGTA